MGSDRFESVRDAFVFVLIMLVVLIVGIILSPIIIPIVIFYSIKEWLANRKFREYLSRNENAKYFCYTSRKTSQNFVRDNILPSLSDEVHVLFIQDKTWSDLNDEVEFSDRIVGSMRTLKLGFPYIAKVVNGELVTESINSRLYSAITRNADADSILRQIDKFFGDASDSNPLQLAKKGDR